MRALIALSSLALMVSMPARAATEADCLAMFKTADVNANGALERSEDREGSFFAALKTSGKSTGDPDVMSRDEFLNACKGDAFAAIKSSGPAAASRDIGKGDITPGTHGLAKDDALKKLNANGFKDVKDLTLDNQNVWRGTAFADGKRKNVSVDSQGDVVAEQGGTGEGSQSMNDQSRALSGSETVASPRKGNSSGLYLWIWILAGGPLLLAFASRIGGDGPSAMTADIPRWPTGTKYPS